MKELIELTRDIHFVNDLWGMMLPMALIGLDVLLGVMGAISNKDFSSSRMRKGLTKKVGEIVILVVGELFSMAFRLPKYIMLFCSLYIIVMELASLIENLGKLGVPVPKFIESAVDQAAETISSEEYDVIVKRIEALEEDKSRDDQQ